MPGRRWWTTPVLMALLSCGPPTPPGPCCAREGGRCDTEGGQQLWVAEWPAADRARLEVAMAEQLAAVEYHGDCYLRVLDDCTTRGSYVPSERAPVAESIEASDEASLLALLPLFAPRFGAEVHAGRTLRLDYVVRGERSAAIGPVPASKLIGGDCDRATHVVRSTLLGAARLSSSALLDAAGSAPALPVGQVDSAATHAERRLIEMGAIDDCDTAGASTCMAPIKLELVPVIR